MNMLKTKKRSIWQMKKYIIKKGCEKMDGLYSVTLMELEDYSICKTWVFDNKKSSYIFLCNLYEKIWKKHYIPNEDGTYNVIEKKSAHPNIEDYKSINFSV